MSKAITSGDIIYTCTSSATPIITPTHLTDILPNRSQHTQPPTPLRFVDISVPRNIDSDCGSVPSVECFNVDDLKEIVETNLFKRKREVIDAELILREEIFKYEQFKETLDTFPTALRLQNKAEELRIKEVSKLTEKLSNSLSVQDMKEVTGLSKRIVANLLRGPLMHLKNAKAGKSTKETILQLQAAFQLE
jgi:glutamyl-tRNA reductase